MIKITDKYAFFFKEWPSNFKAANFEWEYMGENTNSSVLSRRSCGPRR